MSLHDSVHNKVLRGREAKQRIYLETELSWGFMNVHEQQKIHL